MENDSKVPEFLKLVEATPELKEAPAVSTCYPVEEPYKHKNTDKELLPFINFPFDEFPQSFRKMVIRMSAAFHIDPEFTATCMLTIMSAALGNSIRVSPRAGYEVPPFLWTIAIARSGTGKSHPIKELMKTIEKRQADEFSRVELEQLESKADVENGKKPKPYKPATHFWVSDFTIESLSDVFRTNRRGVVLYRDEISGLVSGMNKYRRGDDRQYFLELFDCKSWKINRKTAGNSYIGNTGAAIIGGIQPKVMTTTFKEVEDGLLPRFLVLTLKEMPITFSSTGLSEDVQDSWARLVDWCYSVPLVFDSKRFVKARILSFEPAALKVWASFFDEMKGLEPFLSEKVTPFASKLSGYYSLKFAGLLHCLKEFSKGTAPNQIPEQIDKETVATSIDLTRFFLGQVVQALGLYGNTWQQYDEYEKRLIDALDRVQDQVKNGRIPLSQVVEAFNSTLPEKLRHSSEKVSQLLRRLRLRTERGTGGYANLTWEEEKIKQLIAEVCPYTVTPVTTGGSEGSDGSFSV